VLSGSVSHETNPKLFDEALPRGINREIWETGPDGTYQFRDQADGFFE
jgi:hypothetical protein